MDRTYPAGVPSWIDVEAPDVALAQGFYGELFGWSFDAVAPPGATLHSVIARLDGRDVAGISTGRAGPARWNTYVAVDDAASTLARAEALGARLTRPPEAVGDAGVGAGLADPTGVEIRLWQARRRLGAQVANEPGTWNFSVLHTDDPGVANFYTDLFGWVFDDLGYGVLIRQPGYGDHLAATSDPTIRERQDSISAPEGFADAIGWRAPTTAAIAASWHVTFAVADRDQTVATAERLGSTVLHTDDTVWSHDAVIRDPQGAVFTASQFDPQAG